MPSPFTHAATALRAHGHSVLPLVPGEKRPAVRGWQRHCLAPAGDHLVRQWDRIPGANVGVCLGPAGGLVALDFDEDVGGLHGRITGLVGESPVRKAGRRGHTGFYRFTGERSRHYGVGEASVLDVLAGGRYAVVPPSVHPEGMAYRWLTDRTLENTRADELPVIPPGAMAEVAALLRPVRRLPERVERPLAGRDRIADALACVPPDVPYPAWRDIGMAIHAELGDAGFGLWDRWSSRGEKYPGPDQCRRVWESFRGEGITLGTLFHHAYQWGYRGRAGAADRRALTGHPTDPGPDDRSRATRAR